MRNVKHVCVCETSAVVYWSAECFGVRPRENSSCSWAGVSGGLAEERLEVFFELDFLLTFRNGTQEAKREGGEIGRAAAAVDKALKLAETG